jgi:hypothetical protein
VKILAFGSRAWNQEGIIYRVFSKLPKGTIVVHGGARGADILSDRVAKYLGFETRPYIVTPEEWEREGKAAGVNRNARMLEAEHPDANGVRIEKAFGFATGPVTKKQNRGSFDMAQRLWGASVRFEILFPPRV